MSETHRLGPFPNRDMSRLEAVFDERKIAYVKFLDREALARLESEIRATPHAHGGTGQVTFDPRWIYYDIAATDLPRLADLYHELGVASPEDRARDAEIESELSQTEYLCPQCDYSQFRPSSCPRHHVPLIPWEQWKNIDQSRKEGRAAIKYTKLLVWVLLAISVLLAIFSLMPHDAFSRPEASQVPQ